MMKVETETGFFVGGPWADGEFLVSQTMHETMTFSTGKFRGKYVKSGLQRWVWEEKDGEQSIITPQQIKRI